ncbi:MAG: ABC transporter ATP-binding protein [Thermoanaerobaculaceae bacterium]
MSETDLAVRVVDLSKRFGDVVAVDRLSLDVRRGEVLAVLGPNGAGKTTTLRMMCGLLRPDAGTVELDGRPPGARAPDALEAIGVAPQELVIWEQLTCLEQLRLVGCLYDLPPREAARRAGDLLAAFGLDEKRNRLGRTLSGGMQRRLNIALGLVHRPHILFVDEPQAGLDPQSRVLVREYLRSLAGTATVVVTTHDMEEAAKLADRICILDHGRLLALGTLEEVTRQAGEGDLVEVVLGEGAAEALACELRGLVRPEEALRAQGSGLTLATGRAAELLPAVLEAVRRLGLRLGALHVRRATLEDAFIRLTGRGLRE